MTVPTVRPFHPPTPSIGSTGSNPLARLAEPDPPAFVVLRREGGPVEVFVADDDPAAVVDVPLLAGVPLPDAQRPWTFALVPFRQVGELGMAHHDDATPLRCLRFRHRGVLDVAEAVALLPADEVALTGACFDRDDDAYAELVTRVLAEEIGGGHGANVVIRRDLRARQSLPAPRAALAVLRRLLERERGAYWTFAVHAPVADGAAVGDPAAGRPAASTLVGATPERHVSADGGQVVMNPISGTLRHPRGPVGRAEMLAFLRDRKEVEELFMVVDEELKMMSGLCRSGGRVLGPYLKPMTHLTHTEYLLVGRQGEASPGGPGDPRTILRETMFAATVTGSPLASACRMIARHEGDGRGYYAGMIAGLEYVPDAPARLDAPILIRTAYLDEHGGVRIPVGATLVRHSDPVAETAETHAKLAGLLAAFGPPTSVDPAAADLTAADPAAAAVPPGPALELDDQLTAALAERNQGMADFWRQPRPPAARPRPGAREALVVDAEDGWTRMLAHLLEHNGTPARIVGWDRVEPGDVEGAALLVAGPGPGDPRDREDARITRMRELVTHRLGTGRPLLAVCLSHQLLAQALGLSLFRLPRPAQGLAREVEVFGRPARLGFYNSFAARRPSVPPPGVTCWTAPASPVGDGAVEEVVALAYRRPGPPMSDRRAQAVGVQFHAESLLSTDGEAVLVDLLQTWV